VVEETPGEGLDEALLGFQGVCRNGVGLDPVAVVIDPLPAIDEAAGAFGRRAGVLSDFQTVKGVHGPGSRGRDDRCEARVVQLWLGGDFP